MDMVGETADGTIVQVELQSTNDSEMALRMAEYALVCLRALSGNFPLRSFCMWDERQLQCPKYSRALR